MKTKVPTRRVSSKERTFTNKINCGLNKIPKTLVKEPKERQVKRLSTYQTKKRKMEENKP
jgi:hypothetical protein